MPLISEDHRQTVLEAFRDLDRFNLLQPNQAFGRGVGARRQQWNRIAGGRAGKVNHVWIGLGMVAGAVSGMIAGLQVPPVLEQVPMSMVLAVVLIPVGGYGAHLLSASGAYHQGMMLVIVNERRSVIRPEMVTGEVEAWIPKALLSWRSHEWRYRDGQPYLWLQLPVGERIEKMLRSTVDYLLLPNDLFRAIDSAVYAQRSYNRMLSDSALDFADIEEGDTEGESRLKELLPWLTPPGIVLSGVLLVLMTSS